MEEQKQLIEFQSSQGWVGSKEAKHIFELFTDQKTDKQKTKETPKQKTTLQDRVDFMYCFHIIYLKKYTIFYIHHNSQR